MSECLDQVFRNFYVDMVLPTFLCNICFVNDFFHLSQLLPIRSSLGTN